GWGGQAGGVGPGNKSPAPPGGRVAFWGTGAGPPLLCDSGWITDLRGQLELYSFGGFIERLAERFTVIRYDKPGCGLSDRDGTDLSFDGQVAAALAGAGALGADRVRPVGGPQGGPAAGARSRPGTRSGPRRWCCMGRAPAAGTWRLPRSGSRSWRWCGPIGAWG